jgi:2-hydroxychromene-2-carboxylate isomerase
MREHFVSKAIAFYFDFMSPYAYLGSVQVERVAARLNCPVSWRPMLLGISVVKVMGLKGVADTPLKREYVAHDVARFARYLDIPFNRATTRPMMPLPAARAFVWLDETDPEMARDFARHVFHAQWADGQDMSTPAALASLARSKGIDREALLAGIASDKVKQSLKSRVDASIAAGIFGAPTFVVDDQMFWGVDRLPMVERWLETGGW